MCLLAVMEQDRRGRPGIHERVGAAPGRQHHGAVARQERFAGLAVDGHDPDVVIFKFDSQNSALRSIDKAKPQALVGLDRELE